MLVKMLDLTSCRINGIRIDMKIHDELCAECNLKKNCPGGCLLLNLVGNNVPLRERYSAEIKYLIEDRNYNDLLAEYIEDHQTRSDRLLDIKNVKHRAIASMLLAGINKTQIADILHMSLRQIIRITKHKSNLRSIKVL